MNSNFHFSSKLTALSLRINGLAHREITGVPIKPRLINPALIRVDRYKHLLLRLFSRKWVILRVGDNKNLVSQVCLAIADELRASHVGRMDFGSPRNC